MESGNRLEQGEGWGEQRGEDWARLHALLELARQAHREALSPEQRERIRDRVLERLERNEARRRRRRALLAGVSAVLLTGLLATLVVRARAGGGRAAHRVDAPRGRGWVEQDRQ